MQMLHLHGFTSAAEYKRIKARIDYWRKRPAKKGSV
jgi:hypothetical protein